MKTERMSCLTLTESQAWSRSHQGHRVTSHSSMLSWLLMSHQCGIPWWNNREWKHRNLKNDYCNWSFIIAVNVVGDMLLIPWKWQNDNHMFLFRFLVVISVINGLIFHFHIPSPWQFVMVIGYEKWNMNLLSMGYCIYPYHSGLFLCHWEKNCIQAWYGMYLCWWTSFHLLWYFDVTWGPFTNMDWVN